jgi:hypothetical protein
MVKNDKNRWWGGVQKLFYFSLPFATFFSSSFKKRTTTSDEGGCQKRKGQKKRKQHSDRTDLVVTFCTETPIEVDTRARKMSFTASTTHAHSLCASFRGQSLNNKIATSSATTTTARATPKFTVSAASVGKVKFDGSSAGEANLDLKVARSEVAKGIVHKYVVMVRQNARRVSVCSRR